MICAWAETALEGGANMTILVGIQKGVLAPGCTVDDSFETLKERALDGSDSDQDDDGGTFLYVLIFFVGLFLIIGFIVLICKVIARINRKARRKKLEQQADYFRDAPNGRDLNATYVLGRNLQFCPGGAFLGARILRLITLGSLEPEQSTCDNVSLRLVREPHQGDQYDEAPYVDDFYRYDYVLHSALQREWQLLLGRRELLRRRQGNHRHSDHSSRLYGVWQRQLCACERQACQRCLYCNQKGLCHSKGRN